MKTKLLFTLITWPLLAAAQMREISGDELASVMHKVMQAAGGIESFRAKFTEEKDFSVLTQKHRSEGEMYYLKPGKIRWEYLTPSHYLFIVNDTETIVMNGDRIERGNSGSAMIFRQIGNLILSSISGRKIVDESKFDAKYDADETFFRVAMTPKERRIRQMMSEIIFIFSMNDNYISSVEIKNTSGDLTTIRFIEKEINVPVEAEKFVL